MVSERLGFQIPSYLSILSRMVSAKYKWIVLFLPPAFLLNSWCATHQLINPGGPRRNQPDYPVVLIQNPQRQEAAANAWDRLSNQPVAANKSLVPLQPVTATIWNLPENLSTPLHLAKVGAGAEMSEEQTRESLRRLLKVITFESAR